MKAYTLILGLILASSVALAQPQGGSRSGDKHGKGARMQQELELTDEQMEEMREIREQGGSREEMNAVLTSEQKAKAAELRKERKGERSKRMKEHLGLSDEQVKEMREIRDQGGSREDIRAVLTSEQQEKFDQVRDRKKGQGHKTKE